MRIAALSDQHGYLPEIPACDLLIVAGDICPDRVGSKLARDDPGAQKAWFDANIRPWLAAAPARHTIVTWGNHDWCGQACRFDDHPSTSSTPLQILVDADTRVSATGNGPSIWVWATPWSARFMRWAFMKTSEELAAVYAAIPDGIDILVSHQPPYGLGDAALDERSGRIEHLGSHELLATIARVRPRVVICGHIHEGHGSFRYEGTTIYNVSVVDRRYRLVRAPTVIDVDGW